MPWFGLEPTARRVYEVNPERGIPETKRNDLIEFALEYEALTPRELAIKYTHEKRYFVSESSVYRILKAADLIAAPSHVTIKAASEFHDKTVRINEMWQTDFTYFKIIGWGWYYLSTILDDYSRYIISWKLCTTMKAADVTDTLEMALEASGCNQATVRHKPRLLSPSRDHALHDPAGQWIMDHVISLESLRDGWAIEEWIMFVAHHSIRKLRAKLSVGTRQ